MAAATSATRSSARRAAWRNESGATRSSGVSDAASASVRSGFRRSSDRRPPRQLCGSIPSAAGDCDGERSAVLVAGTARAAGMEVGRAGAGACLFGRYGHARTGVVDGRTLVPSLVVLAALATPRQFLLLLALEDECLVARLWRVRELVLGVALLGARPGHRPRLGRVPATVRRLGMRLGHTHLRTSGKCKRHAA